MRWTEAQYQDFLLKSYPNRAQVERRPDPGALLLSSGTPDPGPPAPESVLQGKIQKWAKEKGYPCQCFRRSSRARGFLTVGWLD